MTKTIKKSFIVLLMLVASLFFAFAVGTGFNSASATEDQAKAAAFIENVKAFETKVGGEDSRLDEAEIRASMTSEENVTLFLNMYMYVISSGTKMPEDALAYKPTYDAIYNGYNKFGAVDLYANITSAVKNVYTMKNQNWKNNAAAVKTAREQWNNFYNAKNTTENVTAENDIAFLKNITTLVLNDESVEVGGVAETRKVPDILVKAEAKVEAWELNINAAIKAIKNIDVVTALTDTETKKVFDATAGKYLETYIGVLASEETLKAAKDAIDKVEADSNKDCLEGAFDEVNHYAVYAKADETYQAQKANVDRVVDLIRKAYAKFQTGVCYSIHDEISNARSELSALSKTAVNDLQSAVVNFKDNNSDEKTYGEKDVSRTKKDLLLRLLLLKLKSIR